MPQKSLSIHLRACLHLAFAQIPKEYRGIDSGEELGNFWRTYGRRKFKLLSEVARSVLGAPASAALLGQRDFCEAEKLVSRQQRGPLDPAYAEMVLFLHGVYDYIPNDIPALSDEQAREAVPHRLKDPTMRRDLAELCAVSAAEEGWLGGGLSLADSDDEREMEREKGEEC